MTIDEMAVRLGIGPTELEVLRAQEAARSLPSGFTNLSDYLEAKLAAWKLHQEIAFDILHQRVIEAFQAVQSLEEREVFLRKVEEFCDGLKAGQQPEQKVPPTEESPAAIAEYFAAQAKLQG